MFKRLIIQFLYENGSKVLNSVTKAYKDIIKNATKGAQNNQNNDKDNNKQGGFGKFNFNNLIATPMTKEESLKILNIKESEMTSEKIMEQFEKYFEANDSMKGGSFYLQNKIYYAKEMLMEKYPKEMNMSKFNPDGKAKAPNDENSNSNENVKSNEKENNEGTNVKQEKDPTEKVKNKNI